MILDGVVCSPRQHSCHVSPLLPERSMGQEQDPLFGRCPFYLQNARVEMVMPSFSALFAQPSRNKLGNKRPPLSPVLLHKPSNEIVLFLSPRLFLEEGRLVFDDLF